MENTAPKPLSPPEVYLEEIIDNPLYGLQTSTKTIETQTITRWQRFAYLIFCNGGATAVTQWGIINEGDFIYKAGLTQHEALELIFASGFLVGLNTVEPKLVSNYMLKINNYLMKHTKYFEENFSEKAISEAEKIRKKSIIGNVNIN